MIDERRNNIVYGYRITEKDINFTNTRKMTDVIYYIGRGNDVRVNNNTGYNEFVMAFLAEHPEAVKFDFAKNLTLSQAKELEAQLIKQHWHQPQLLNRKQEPVNNEFWDIYKNVSGPLNIKDRYDAIMNNVRGKDKITPDQIMEEWFSYIPNKYRRPHGDNQYMEYLVTDPWARYGHSIKYINDFNHFSKITAIFENYTKIADGMHNGNMGDKMPNLDIKCCDFLKDYNSTKKQDLVILNPPFEGEGLKFIMKSTSLLKKHGHLCVVMSPTWRTISVESDDQDYQSRILYNQLRKKGCFKLIHTYSAKETQQLFGQNIVPVDTFVWQKGVEAKETTIINVFGQQFTANLANYPQAFPVLPLDVYDVLFDQVNGLGIRSYTALRDERSAKTNPKMKVCFTHTDPVTGAEFMCNQVNVDKCLGKKVVIDRDFKRMYVDDKGNQILNCSYFYKYTTDHERDCIVRTLTYIMDNELQDAFRNRSSAPNIYLPRIRVA